MTADPTIAYQIYGTLFDMGVLTLVLAAITVIRIVIAKRTMGVRGSRKTEHFDEGLVWPKSFEVASAGKIEIGRDANACWLCDSTLSAGGDRCPACGVDQKVVPIRSVQSFKYIDFRNFGGAAHPFRNCLCCLRETNRSLQTQPSLEMYVAAPYCFACRLRFKFVKAIFVICLAVAWFLVAAVLPKELGLVGWGGTVSFFGAGGLVMFVMYLVMDRSKLPSVGLAGHAPLCVAITSVSGEISDSRANYVRQFRFGNKAVAERVRRRFPDGTEWQRKIFARSPAKTEAEWRASLEI